MSKADSLNILFVTVRSDHGGGPKHLIDLIKWLTKSASGINVFFAAPMENPYGPIFKQLSHEYVEIPHRKITLLSFLKVVKFIKKNRIQVIHSHGRGAGFYSRLIKVLFPRIKVVHTFHGFHTEESLSGRIKLILDKTLSKFADHYISISDSEYTALVSNQMVSNVPISIIRNCLDFDFTREHDFEVQNTAESVVKVGFLGRYDVAKGIDILCRNLSAFVKRYPELNCQFYLAGFDKITVLKDLLWDKNLEDNVQVCGLVDDGISFLKDKDLLISTSRHEGLPLVVLEAMSLAKPCLLSNVRGHDYFIERNIAIGFDLASEKDFSDQLEKLISNRQLRSQIGSAGQRFILENHDIENMGSATLALYKSIDPSKDIF